MDIYLSKLYYKSNSYVVLTNSRPKYNNAGDQSVLLVTYDTLPHINMFDIWFASVSFIATGQFSIPGFEGMKLDEVKVWYRSATAFGRLYENKNTFEEALRKFQTLKRTKKGEEYTCGPIFADIAQQSTLKDKVVQFAELMI